VHDKGLEPVVGATRTTQEVVREPRTEVVEFVLARGIILCWQELLDVCLLLGGVVSRSRGDHLVMTRPGMARPVVIKMDKDLGEDVVRSNLHTLGVSRAEFMALLAQERRRHKPKQRSSR
jgi:hypothetical protein